MACRIEEERHARQAHRTSQREVFALLARGYRHGEIRERLLVSPSTVHAHVTNIYAKMGLHAYSDLSRTVREARNRTAR